MRYTGKRRASRLQEAKEGLTHHRSVFIVPAVSSLPWQWSLVQGRHKLLKRPPGSLVGRNRAHHRHSQEPQWDQNSRIWDISANGDLLPLSLEQSPYLGTRQLLGPPSPADGLQDILTSPRTSRRPPGQAVRVESPVPPASCALGEGWWRPALRGRDTKPRVRDLQIGLQKPQKDKAWR